MRADVAEIDSRARYMRRFGDHAFEEFGGGVAQHLGADNGKTVLAMAKMKTEHDG